MRIIRNGHFWLILVVFALFCVLHYAEQMGFMGTEGPSDHFGLSRHSLGRILFLLPIIYSSFIFGLNGGLIASFVALVAMLPRTVLISPSPVDASLETAGIFIAGTLVSVWTWTWVKQRGNIEMALAELQRTHEILQHYVRTARDSERRQTILNLISTTLSQSLDLEKTLNKAVHMVSELMEVEITLMFSLDEGSEELRLVAYEGISDEFAQAVDGIKIGEGFYGEVAKTGQPIVVEDPSPDPRLSRPEVKRMKIHIQLIAPLLTRERITGIVCVAMRRPRKFFPEDIELLTAVGSQISTAIENARLYEQDSLAAQRLAVSERNYRRLFENANDAIWVHDLEGNIIAANEAIAKLTGYSVEELVKMNVMHFMSDEIFNLASQIRRQLMENQPVDQPYEQRLLRKNGTEAILKLTTSLVKEDGTPTGFHHIARDITEERRMQDNLRYYLQEITRSQEEERKRIARELHDDTAQALHALSRQVDNFIRSNTNLPADNAAFLRDLNEQVGEVLQGVRRFGQDLRPPMLDDLGLLATLRWLVREMKEKHGIDADLILHGIERRLPAEIELTLFRIAQEALRNVEKHAEASKVVVNIGFDEVKAKISVSDDGRGFELPGSLGDLARIGKLGLAGMEERARLLGGGMKIESEPGKGTTIVIEAPI